MTTQFASFGQSELGAFAESLLHAREDGGDLWIGGNFLNGHSPAITLRRIARFLSGAWTEFNGGANGIVYNFNKHLSKLIMCGAFTTLGGVSANRVISWDGHTLTGLGSGRDGQITCSCIHNGNLIVGGSQTNGVSQWDGTTWTDLGTEWNGLPVFALASFGGNLYAAGDCGGTATRGFAKWDGANWTHALNGTNAVPAKFFNDNLGVGKVQALQEVNGKLAIAFQDTVSVGDKNSATIKKVIVWDGGTLPNTGAGGTVNPNVENIHTYNDTLAVHLGLFGGNLVASIYTSSGTIYQVEQWSGSGTTWSNIGGTVGSTINNFYETNGKLYAVGAFTTVNGGGTTAYKIAFWDGTTWNDLGGGVDDAVQAMIQYP